MPKGKVKKTAELRDVISYYVNKGAYRHNVVRDIMMDSDSPATLAKLPWKIPRRVTPEKLEAEITLMIKNGTLTGSRIGRELTHEGWEWLVVTRRVPETARSMQEANEAWENRKV